MGEKTVSGACLCGAVRFAVQMPSLFCGHCHCSMCRRNHGAAYVTWFSVTPEQLSITSGEPDLVRYRSSAEGTRTFCGRCGSSLFFITSKDPGRLDVVLANMDGPIDIEPQAHIHYDFRCEWARVGDELPRLGGPTGLEPLAEDD